MNLVYDKQDINLEPFLINFVGDSMKPELKAGDQLICQAAKNIIWGHLYYIETSEEYASNKIFRYMIKNENDGLVTLRAAEPEIYPDIIIPINAIEKASIVLGMKRIYLSV